MPMYRGNAQLVGPIDFCGPARTLVMPSFVMGDRLRRVALTFSSLPL